MEKNILNHLAVIIPVGPEEDAWQTLLPDLASLPEDSEILLIGAVHQPQEFKQIVERTHKNRNVRWLVSPPGRAHQLNTGARSNDKGLLWFLHADSRIQKNAIESLRKSLEKFQEAIYFFNLRFLEDGPALTHLNAIGAWVRSRWLRLPFGDQGFCLPRWIFERLGGFDEKALYGEDHLFVWAARRHGIPLRCTGATLLTSARRYREAGWCKVTLGHLRLTVAQTIPEVLKWVR